MRPCFQAALLMTLGLVALAPNCAAQNTPDATDMAVDAATRHEVIEGVLSRLEASYVFPEAAREMAAAVRQRARRGEYDRIATARAFADSLTAHLRVVSRDKHLRVSFSPRPIVIPGSGGLTPEARAQHEAQMRHVNFGFEKAERLEGNVGYLEVRGFVQADVEGAEEAVAAAMDFLARTDALIIDLRRNGGGDPRMVRLLSSYLFGEEPVHLNSLYWRPDDRTEEFWTLSEVAGTRYGPDRPVYVLTSTQTFSGAEEFSYNLKSLRRATIVGETTGGGAHPGGLERVTDHFGVWVPRGRAINPVTGTNWEGAGVEPDVKVSREGALAVAHLAALRALRAEATDPEHRASLEQAIRRVEQEG
jgi:retinol-binding protein 3